MKIRYIPALIILFLVLPAVLLRFYPDRLAQDQAAVDLSIEQAFAGKISEVTVSGSGVVLAVLSDDLKDSRHQRFIVRLDSKLTLLIVHNIDLAPRIDTLRVGDIVTFRGEYVWNAQGGLLHWTHHDPAGRRDHGWISHAGRLYQ
ncbi:DUF3465 domain-containing protein [Desulfopila inferna]|uniref:DUF3465 domain-containing protein n=1 Tax=Desulfopila inferna TaxID=468528 RepID=UPI00196394D2|nr:DUF3465 domain-containing protein [Desulfopila inferna]MBM9606156.1 DUF3465 domain-containing protein [Desulfopila inferna]